MYPWYREAPLSVGQICSPLTVAAAGTTTIKTETGYGDCMLDFHSKVSFFGDELQGGYIIEGNVR